MTGDDGMRVLGLNLDSPYSTCTEIMVKNGRGWLEGRLQHYQDLSDELFRPEGKELAEAPTRRLGRRKWYLKSCCAKWERIFATWTSCASLTRA